MRDELDRIAVGARIRRLGADFRWPGGRKVAVVFNVAYEGWSDGVAPGLALPSTVIVVDDIITTTATLEACASVLRDAGADAVYGFAVAREV